MIEKNVGIIGFGSMGSMLLNGFIDSQKINKSNIYLSNRTIEKLNNLSNSGINICPSNKMLAKNCDMIFICAKPLEIKDILIEIKSELNNNKHLISIAGSLTLDLIEKYFNGKISRLIPTVISEINEGITLICHNSKVSDNDNNLIVDLFKNMSEIKNIPENEFEIISELTSCAPGLIAAIFKEYLNSAIMHTNLDKKEIYKLVIKTLFGTSKYLYETKLNFDDVIKRVATKGGATEAGVEVIENKIPEVFDEMFTKTLERQNKRKENIKNQFNNL